MAAGMTDKFALRLKLLHIKANVIDCHHQCFLTTMSPIQFKLVQTGPGALTRRVTFSEQPSWFALASRVESLFGIPLQDVGVSYVDSYVYIQQWNNGCC